MWGHTAVETAKSWGFSRARKWSRTGKARGYSSSLSHYEAYWIFFKKNYSHILLR